MPSVDLSLLLLSLVSVVLPVGLTGWFIWQVIKRERLEKTRGFEVKLIAGSSPAEKEKEDR